MIRVLRSEVLDYFHEHHAELIPLHYEYDRQTAKHTPSDPNKRGYCCRAPGCNSGNGPNGTGMSYNAGSKTPGHYKCWSCGHSDDLIGWLMLEEGITDFEEGIKRACEVYQLELVYDSQLSDNDKTADFLNRQAKQREKERMEKEEKKKQEDHILETVLGEKETYKDLIKQAQKKIESPEALNYLSQRGISLSTAKYYGLGYAENIFVGNRNFEKCIVLPSSLSAYSVRDMDPNVEAKDKARKPKGGTDSPLGLFQIIKEHEKEGSERTSEPVFIVEGLFDAPSFHEAGASAIALNGTANIDPIITVWNHYKINRPLILALDNDDAGRKATQRLSERLRKANIPHTALNIVPAGMNVKDANEFLVKDRQLFIKTVQEAKIPKLFHIKQGLVRNRDMEFTERMSNPPTPIPTGFPILDKELGGGMYSDLYTLGAISSLGKSSFVVQIGADAAVRGVDVIYVSLEMGADEIMARCVSRYTAKDAIDKNKSTYGGKTIRGVLNPVYSDFFERQHLQESKDRFIQDTGDHFNIVEGIGLVSVDDIKEIIETYRKYTSEDNRILLILDYLQLLQPPKEAARSLTSKDVTDINIMRLKQLTRDYDCTILAISSFNRNNYTQSVNSASFKESGSIEYGSSVLIGIEREAVGSKEISIEDAEKKERKTGIKKLRLKILKQRNGLSGGHILYNFHSRFNYFIERGEEDMILEDPDFTEVDEYSSSL